MIFQSYLGDGTVLWKFKKRERTILMGTSRDLWF